MTATTLTEAKAMCQAEIDRCTAIAKRNYPRVVLPTPRLTFKLRGGTAGEYNPTTHEIKINAVLLMENLTEMVENTVSHEYAHLVDRAVHGEQFGRFNRRTGRRNRIVHGPTFKRIQREFGRCDATFHNMDTTNAKVREGVKHIWKCGCGEGVVELGPKRHAKQMRLGGDRGFYQRGHTVRRCGAYTYFGIKGQEIQPMQIAAKKSEPKASSGTESKLDKCRRVYDPILSRAANIVAFVEEGCTQAGAATYYAKIKKEFG